VLELAAGSGRVAVPLAAAGHDVVAVDRDPHMLERARRRWEAAAEAGRGSLELVEADVTDYQPDGRFDLVILAFNSLLLLDREMAQRAALETMARALDGDGAAVIDVWLPGPDDLAIYDGRQVLDWVRHDSARKEWVAKVTAARYSAASRVAQITSIFDAWRDGEAARRTMRQDTISFVTTSELATAAASAGLRINTIAGDYALNPLADDSDRVVLICGRHSD
jgi:SAM-dependent methyltransferase